MTPAFILPEGKRGFGPCRALRYGIDSVTDYIDHGHKELCRFLQVESKDAVEAMDEVCKIPYVDGFIIGPMDRAARWVSWDTPWRARKPIA